MAKLTLNDVSNITGNPTSAATTINANAALIETAMENTLSRDGTSPNTMGAALDMNSHQILNLPACTDDTDPIRKTDLTALIDSIKVGPAGPTGPAGADGTNGTNGADGLGVPAGGTTGQVLAKASDTDNDTEWVDTVAGSTSDEATFTKPVVATFTSTNYPSGGSSADTSNGIILQGTATSSNTNALHYMGIAKPASGATGWRADAKFRFGFPRCKWICAGIALRDGSSGKVQTIGLGGDSTIGNLQMNTFSDFTTWVSVTDVELWNDHEVWFRIQYDGSSYTAWVSPDGVSWWGNIALTYPVSPSEVGFFLNPNAGDAGTSATVKGSTVFVKLVSWVAGGY